MPSLFVVRLLAVCVAAALCICGCAPGASVIPPGERTHLADVAVADAVAAYNKGDLERGDAVLNRAVILLTDSDGSDFSDTGYIAVAKRINEKGRPQDALRLLHPLTNDKRVSWNPLLWATIADTAKQAGDLRQEAEAQTRAQAEANALVQTFGAAIPAKDKALRLAERATRAGQYFDEHMHDYPKALQCYREAYRLLPEQPFTGGNLGYMLAEHGTTPGDFEEAVTLTRAAAEQLPEEPALLDSFGWALYKRGDAKQSDYAGARRRLREAVDLAPDLSEARYHLAVVYDALHEPVDALREANVVVRLAPTDARAKALQDRLTQAVAALPSPAPSPSTATTQSPPPEP